MKINFTKKQYETLMKIVYLGNWLANANRNGSDEDPHKEEYEKIEDYIFSFAKEFGLDEFIDHEERYGDRYYPTRKFEEETDVRELIEEYDSESFWDEAVERFGDRDFLRKHSRKAIEKMDRDERFIKVMDCQEKYEREFRENGIERMEIKE